MSVVVSVGFRNTTTINESTGETLFGNSYSIGVGAGLPINASSGTTTTRQYNSSKVILHNTKNGNINFFTK